MDKRLYRSKNNKMIAGVCAGIAEYFNIDPTIVRILFAISLFTWGAGFIAYIICAIVIPENAVNYEDYNNSDYNVYAENTTDNPPTNPHKTRYILGIVLIGVGAFSIVDRYFHWFDYDLVWPLAIIGVGLLILFKDR